VVRVGEECDSKGFRAEVARRGQFKVEGRERRAKRGGQRRAGAEGVERLGAKMGMRDELTTEDHGDL
jgi:hypothetical protein